MRTEEVFHDVECVRRSGAATAIRSIEYDSREVGKGAMFVAMQGGTVDGNAYIDAAVRQGAVAIVTDSREAFDRAAREFPRLALAQVPHGRRALSALTRNFYNHPEDDLALTGVTGTNGKTTTAFLLDAIMNANHRKTVLVGTIEYHVAGKVLPSPHTTPESRDLLQLLAEGAMAGATEAIMEVSSHALEQGRVHGLPYDIAIFTNLTRDHLDYHQTMEKYYAAKRMLFDDSLGTSPRVAVVNIEDDHGPQLALTAQEYGADVYSYGIEAGAFRADDIRMQPSGMRFTMQTPIGSAELVTKLTGHVNVYNLLAASAAALGRGLTLDQVVAGIASLPHVPGRFESVDAGQPFTVIVDYAHTDDALRNLLKAAREFVAPAGGRVITVFGCGGDRDRTKRPLMGRAAGEASDYVVLTSDNPRSEDPRAILNDVLPGLRETGARYAAEPDRAEAIRMAVAEARAGDIVLIAGKGHEKTQTIGDRVLPFDDTVVARAALASLAKEARA